jgi:uroporphyrinogen-III decarboxylase
LEYLGEAPLFYALHDNPRAVERLLDLLDEQLTVILKQLETLQVPYVEFPDNLHGMMTNPKLFQRYCLPHLQRYTGLLHAQGKRAGSHTDGDVKPLLKLLAMSGLDVCESVSPAPLTPATIEEIWDAWQAGPVIWGAIPTPILEERTPEDEFRAYIERLLHLVGRGPIILGLVDLCMRHNSIERVKYIAARLQGQALPVHP